MGPAWLKRVEETPGRGGAQIASSATVGGWGGQRWEFQPTKVAAGFREASRNMGKTTKEIDKRVDAYVNPLRN